MKDDGATRIIYGDNMAAIALARGCGQASWRTRHLRIRSQILKEAIEGKGPDQVVWELHHLRGTELPADGLTKPLAGQSFRNFVIDLGMRKEERKDPTRGDAPPPRPGGTGAAAATIMISSLMMAEATGVEGAEADALWIGAVGLMMLGLVYAGKIAVAGVKGCLRRLYVEEEPVIVVGESDDDDESLCLTPRSGLAATDEAPSGMTSRSGLVAAGGVSSGMTSQSGVAAAGGVSSGMTSRSGLAAAGGTSSGMTPRSGSAAAGGVSSSLTSQSGSAAAGGASSSLTSRSGSVAAADRASSSLTSWSGLVEDEQQLPVEVERAQRTQARRKKNPWNEFQKANKGRGWSSTVMAKMYREYKDF